MKLPTISFEEQQVNMCRLQKTTFKFFFYFIFIFVKIQKYEFELLLKFIKIEQQLYFNQWKKSIQFKVCFFFLFLVIFLFD